MKKLLLVAILCIAGCTQILEPVQPPPPVPTPPPQQAVPQTTIIQQVPYGYYPYPYRDPYRPYYVSPRPPIQICPPNRTNPQSSLDIYLGKPGIGLHIPLDSPPKPEHKPTK